MQVFLTQAEFFPCIGKQISKVTPAAACGIFHSQAITAFGTETGMVINKASTSTDIAEEH